VRLVGVPWDARGDGEGTGGCQLRATPCSCACSWLRGLTSCHSCIQSPNDLPRGRGQHVLCRRPLPRRGIVMGRLRSAQRQREVQVMRFCLNKLGEREVGWLVG
jgi:hypothetical protein